MKVDSVSALSARRERAGRKSAGAGTGQAPAKRAA